eukprot:TRINITY_DN48254_c0_g1_i1.p1 TRINITY_DN48254_c0_g1~~TRINITY_DN48254_c0_g1_i1.p1  ORF type:complete len:314 (-),score=76.45 TRINITY_DN48254_c0_g1_i1:81-1022(-)
MFADVLKTVAQTPSENALRSNMAVPVLCTVGLLGVLTYHHTTQEEYDHDISHFLVIVVVSMLPLLTLKMKMYTCGDRLALVPVVIVKTLLMHLIMSLLRLAPWAIKYERFEMKSPYLWFDAASLVACIFILKNVFNYQFSLRIFSDEREVRNLVLGSCVLAGIVEFACIILPQAWVSGTVGSYSADRNMLYKIVFTAGNYVDVVAFMPVVWKLYQAEQDDDDSYGTQVPEHAKQQVIMFFAFVCGFYAWDDVIDPLRTFTNSKGEAVVMMAHAAHYMLLLDFASFFVYQVWTPSGRKGEQLQGLLEQGFDGDD